MRLTKDVIQQLLDINEGFVKRKVFVDRNFLKTDHYLIKDGQLLIRSIGKTSWADSQHDKNVIVDTEQIARL